MGLFKTIFGGKDNSAQKGQVAANANAIDFIKSQGALSRSDLLSLGLSADANRDAGYQAALDEFAQSVPQQIGAFTAGNAAAQAAILGGDTSIFKIDPNMSFSAQRVPGYITIADALAGPDFEQQKQIEGIKTNADLLRAAANGVIPGLSSADKQWFGQLLQQTPGMNNFSNYVTDPIGSIGTVTGTNSGLTSANQIRMQNLLSGFGAFING